MFLKTSEQLHAIYYILDPGNYLTPLGLAWNAMLLTTQIKIGLTAVADMFKMIEQANQMRVYAMQVYRDMRRQIYVDVSTIRQSNGFSCIGMHIIYMDGLCQSAYHLVAFLFDNKIILKQILKSKRP